MQSDNRNPASAHHWLKPSQGTLQGTFNAAHTPALRVASGDTVIFSTLDGDWHVEPQTSPKKGSGVFFLPTHPHQQDGHALTGPVYVEGAMPGDSLKAEILECVPGAWGWSSAGIGPVEYNRDLGIYDNEEKYLLWDIDAANGTATSWEGHRVRLSPFPGVIGIVPQGAGDHTTRTPGQHGGNLDCRELTAGSALHIPVFHEGAYFYVGDGHARQGDGEVSGTAIECPLDRLTIRLTVEKSPPVPDLYATTAGGWVAFGFSGDLDAAAHEAARAMSRLMNRLFGFTHCEALNLMGVAVDMRITQIVNGIQGVHVILPYDAIG